MESEVEALRVGNGLQMTLRRLGSLAGGIAAVATVIGLATFATGWWIFDGSRPVWAVIGGVLCLVPIVTALTARHIVRATAASAPELVANVRQFMDTSMQSAKVLIDHDSGQPVTAYAKSFSTLRGELDQRRKELPALFASVRAIMSVPGLAAVSVLGILAVGALGTILLIGGVID